MDAKRIRRWEPLLDRYLAEFHDCFGRCDTRTIEGCVIESRIGRE